MPRPQRIAFFLLGLIGLGCLTAGVGFAVESSKPPRDAVRVSREIDREIQARLDEAKVPASPRADDGEFLRRVTLDILGRVPTYDRTVAFLADTDPDKRRKLIDECLADPEYGQHFARIWFHRMVQPTVENRRLIDKSLEGWLAERINRNDGWNSITREILAAEGERDDNPATVFFLNHVDNKKFAPPRAAATASRLFLGIRLECCECHNHPFDTELKQTDFWGVAAFFGSTSFANAGKKNESSPAVREATSARPAAAKKADAKAAKEAVAKAAKKTEAKAAAAKKAEAAGSFGSIVIPDSNGKTVKATYLLAKEPAKVGSSRLRESFADWVVNPKNPYFAKAAANRMWANFFGRGIVNPVDDMLSNSVNSHPAVLKILEREFADSGFDNKHLIRVICNSEAYQRSSQALPNNKSDDELYSHAKLKVMSADVLFDSLQTVLTHSLNDRAAGRADGKAVAKKPIAKGESRDPREAFRDFFHAEADDDAGVIDEYTHGIPQVLRLMNARTLNDTAKVITRHSKAGSPDRVIDALYLHVLSRPATSEEIARGKKHLSGVDAKTGYSDLMWALLNSSEFLFIH